MSSRARWRLLKELEDKGVTPDFHASELTGRVQLHCHGIPVLTGRVAEGTPSGGSAWTEAWALKITGPSGIRILHVGGDSRNFGLRTERKTTVAQATTVPGDVSIASRGIEIYGVYSLHVPESTSFARLKQIPIDEPF